MKSNEIFIGTIRQCICINRYEEYGDEKFFPEFEINHNIFGSTEKYTKQITDQAILIRVNENKYIWINHLTSFKDDLLVNLGLPIKAISTKPSCDNDLFVVEDSLKPYFNNTENKNISVNKLRRKVLIDPRIRGGIEH